ncbi:MFS transporter [Pseudolysinimonas sp.]|jgi:MFS family permease|uniref:MFS transporter n=1 Tax=Pseudolysinimonas sp. TaxID=2680009 RepID=UPI003784ADB9
MSAMFRALGVRNYRLWFAGTLVSSVGLWMQRIAQDWLVLTELTDDDASAVGLTMALNFGPQLLLAPFAGVITDRVSRRALLVVTQIAMAVLAVGLGVLTVTGVVELWMVFGFALALGIASAFDAPARQAFVSDLVPVDRLGNAVALGATAFNSARLIGPALAGLLVAAIGTGWVFFINAATYLAVILVLGLLRRDDFTERRRSPRSASGFRDGLRYLRKRPDIRLVLVVVFLIGIFGLNFALFLATMVRIEFEAGPEALGIVSSIMAVGSVIGALLSARRERPRLRTVTIAGAGLALGLVACAAAPNLVTFAAAAVVTGFASLTMLTTANGYVQTMTSPAFRGRVMAVYLAVLFGGTPIGAPLLGAIANVAGPRWALLVGAAGCLLAAVIAAAFFVRTRQVRLRFVRRVWPLRVEYGNSSFGRELATTEIAIVEAETTKV